MRHKWLFASIIAIALICFFIIIFNVLTPKPTSSFAYQTLQELESQYAHMEPKQWGEDLDGITQLLPRAQPTVYLTFDACGGDYDENLIRYLDTHHIAATLFINARWIKKHPATFIALSTNPLFSIQNHGSKHLPLSANGRSIYHIKGTDSIKALYDEIMDNDQLITTLTGKKPHFFRSGTAYYDEIAVSILKDLGYEVGGFDILGDGGATFSKAQILRQIQNVQNGSILIYHFNKPQSDTYEGIKAIVPLLSQKGFIFGKLE